MLETACPDDKTLEDLLLGRLARGELDQWESHFVACDKCARRAASGEFSDFFTQAIQSPSHVEIDPAEIETLRERGLQAFEDTRARALGETAEMDAVSVQGLTTSLESDEADDSFSFLEPAAEDGELGRLADYRILKLLGRGGMGMVFLAEDETLRRHVALKVMSPALPRDGAERFLREARSLAAIVSDHIVPIYQVGEHNRVPYMEMQLLQGESLADRMRRQEQFSPDGLCKLGEQAARGLAAAHRSGMIHRDIKPGNIWLEAPNDRVKLLDFGLARGLEDMGLTQTGVLVGTPRYMSPEQAESRPLDHRSDLFSLGTVMYEAALGKAPFQADSVSSTIFAIVSRAPEPISETRADIPPGLSDLIMQLLEKDPLLRPQSADEVAEKFSALHESLSSQASAPASLPDRIAQPATSTKSKRVVPRHYRLAAAVGFIFLALLATIVIRWETPSGTVLVTLDSAEQPIEIDVNDEVMRLVDPSDGKTIHVTIDEAEQQMRLEKEGFQTVTKQFSLSSEDGRRMAVQFEPSASPSSDVAGMPIPFQNAASPSAAAGEERRIAQWIIERHGIVQVQTAGSRQSDQEHHRVETLPDAPFLVNAIWIPPESEITESDFEVLTGLQGRVRVNFPGTAFTGECFKHLGKLDTLFQLNVQYCHHLDGRYLNALSGSPALRDFLATKSSLGDELAKLASEVPTMTRVEFGTELTGDGLRQLAGCEQVHTVNLVHCNKLTSDDFAHLGELPGLARLSLGLAHLTPEIIGHIATVDQLEQFTVLDDKTDRFDLALLSRLTQIETLSLEGISLRDVDLSPLGEMDSLTRLLVGNCNLSDAQLADLQAMLPACELVY